MENTLRKNLIDTINELNKLLYLSITDEQIANLRKKRKLCFVLLEEVIEQEISDETDEFKEAIVALQEATSQAKEVKNDIEKISKAISKISKATKQVEKIVKVGIDIVA